ncbi:hypothetical protein GM51_0145 [freshwater metagenome]|uniref:Uncharacterized protein n=1 Tax=freshwater metagenome TaxID=449393 RepID=A0A094QBZ4_9ZZZZ
MNSKRITIAWLVSILLLVVFAGFSWLELELTPEAGAQKFEISGYQVFPIISALLLLQGAALLSSVLTPVAVGRAISGLLVPIMLAHAIFVVVGLQSNLQNAVAVLISEITGVEGIASQAQFVEFAGDTYLWVGYLLSIAVNLAVLLTKAVSKAQLSKTRPNRQETSDELDLWETQK